MKTPELSIIMPVYNAAKYLAEAVESLLVQSFSDFELIIIDDASTDGSSEIAEMYDDGRIKLFHNEKNSGIVFSRNRGLSEATGDFIAPFDADDVALPGKFAKQIRFLKRNPGYGMVGSWVKFINGNGETMKGKWKLPAKPEKIPAIMLFRNYFVQSTVVIRREALPPEGYRKGYDVVEDYKMWIEIAAKHKVWNLPEYLVNYRVHDQSATNSDSRRLTEQDRLIYRDLFNALDIELTPQNFDTHMIIKQNDPILQTEILKRIEEHLKMLLLQNRKTKIYDERMLKKVIFNRWMKCCFRARSLGPSAIGMCLSSSLTKKHCCAG